MISKSLFLKLQKEDLKRRIWTVSLFMLVFFLLYTVICALNVSNYLYRNSRLEYSESINAYITEEITSFMGMGNEIMLLITMGCAIVSGLSGFFFLHSKKKVDLYHSIPIRREMMFSAIYLNGLLIYIVPYLINLILCFIVLGINKYMTMGVFTTALIAFGVNILYYILIYTLAIIAVMLTGSFVVSCLGAAVLYLYGSLIVFLKETYFSMFFATYLGAYNSEDMLFKMSPIGNYILNATEIADGYLNRTIFSIITTIIANILLIAFAIFLYKKRPSEAAGKAMAFRISQPIIKFALVIPLTLAGGSLFVSIANYNKDVWLVFGLLISLIVVYGIIEIIYNFDIRSAFHGKYHLIISVITIALIACIIRFDLFRYDFYIPKEKDVKSISVAIEGIDGHIRYYEIEKVNNITKIQHSNSYSYQLENMKLTDKEAAFTLASLGIDSVPIYKKKIKSYMLTDVDSNDNKTYYNIKMKFTLKSGREVFRQYSLPLEDSFNLLNEIYNDSEYKKGHYPIYQWDVDNITKITCSNVFNDKEFSFDFFKKNQLLEIYKAELASLSLEEIAETQPVAELFFHIDYYQVIYYVYPSFTNTISFLKEHGFDATKGIEADDIREIHVTNLRYNEDKLFDEQVTVNAASADVLGREVKYTDKEAIKDIFSSLVPRSYYWNNSLILDAEDSIEVSVIIDVDEYGNYDKQIYYFRTGQMPNFVKRDIGYESVE